jgi:hypothetical protein
MTGVEGTDGGQLRLVEIVGDWERTLTVTRFLWLEYQRGGEMLRRLTQKGERLRGMPENIGRHDRKGTGTREVV